MAQLAIKIIQLFQLSQVGVVGEWATEMLYIAESVSFKIANMLLHEFIHGFVLHRLSLKSQAKMKTSSKNFKNNCFYIDHIWKLYNKYIGDSLLRHIQSSDPRKTSENGPLLDKKIKMKLYKQDSMRAALQMVFKSLGSVVTGLTEPTTVTEDCVDHKCGCSFSSVPGLVLLKHFTSPSSPAMRVTDISTQFSRLC